VAADAGRESGSARATSEYFRGTSHRTDRRKRSANRKTGSRATGQRTNEAACARPSWLWVRTSDPPTSHRVAEPSSSNWLE